jgi:hypothetical protein
VGLKDWDRDGVPVECYNGDMIGRGGQSCLRCCELGTIMQCVTNKGANYGSKGPEEQPSDHAALDDQPLSLRSH